MELIFQINGNIPFSSDLLNNRKIGYATEFDKLKRKKPEIPSGPGNWNYVMNEIHLIPRQE